MGQRYKREPRKTSPSSKTTYTLDDDRGTTTSGSVGTATTKPQRNITQSEEKTVAIDAVEVNQKP
jgi:hypothetical protein